MDPWLLNSLDRLQRNTPGRPKCFFHPLGGQDGRSPDLGAPESARSPGELQAILDDLEDQYESFLGPGLEMVDQRIEEIRRRLSGMQS
ncbi:MAG: hypothetical protein ACUVSD_05540 [Thiobacillaceae bacterium]